VAGQLGLVVGPAEAGHDLFEPLMGPTAHLSEPDQRARKFWFREGINRRGTVLSLGLPLSLWEQLDSSDKAVISAATSEAYHQSISEHAAHDSAVAPHLLAARGIQTGALPDDVTRAISHASGELIRKIAADSAGASRIHESYMQFRQSVTGLPDPVGSQAAV